MKEMHCGDCRYYIPHYVKERDKYREIYCGNCIRWCNLRIVMCVDDVCKFYEEKKSCY